MPHRDYYPIDQAIYAIYSQFMQPEPAAIVPPVPPVHLSREQWENIKKIITDLRALKQSFAPRSLETVLIQGEALIEIMEAAENTYLPEERE